MESAETCKKDPDGIFFGLAAEIETRQMWVGGCTFSCPVLKTVKPDNMDTAQAIIDRTVRAACGFESEYVRDDAADSFAVRMRGLLYARFDRRREAAKIRRRRFLRMFRLAHCGPRLSPRKVRGSRGELVS